MSEMTSALEPTFANLRQLLTEPPSEELWRTLREMFDFWPGGQDKRVALDYASSHLDAWNPSLRIVYKVDPQHSLWSLAKTLNVSNQQDGLYLMEGLRDVDLLEHIQSLQIRYRDWLKLRTPLLEKLVHLESLTLTHCNNLDSIALDGMPCPNLQHLSLLRCDHLERLEGLATLPSLRSLKMTRLLNLRSLKWLEQTRSLTSLELGSCVSLRSLDELSNQQQLQHLHIGGLDKIRSLDALGKLTNLRTLFVSDCKFVGNTRFLRELIELEELELRGGQSMLSFDADLFLPKLRKFALRDAPQLRNKQFKSETLEEVYMSWLFSLKELTLKELPALEKLTLKMAPHMTRKTFVVEQQPEKLKSLKVWGGQEHKHLYLDLQDHKETQSFLVSLLLFPRKLYPENES